MCPAKEHNKETVKVGFLSMAITNFVKRIQDVMRNDAGVNGDAQRIEQIVWTLFLKIYDAKYKL